MVSLSGMKKVGMNLQIARSAHDQNLLAKFDSFAGLKFAREQRKTFSCEESLEMRYVAAANSKIYHLPSPRSERATLCGVKFLALLLPKPPAGGLGLVEKKPTGYTLCLHCSRVTREDSKLLESTESFL